MLCHGFHRLTRQKTSRRLLVGGAGSVLGEIDVLRLSRVLESPVGVDALRCCLELEIDCARGRCREGGGALPVESRGV